HRDLKPGNILLAGGADEAGLLAPRITDFGLAKLLDRPGDETRTGTVLGTPRYCAPEQVEGRRADIGPATDIHALRLSLYEMLTLTTPFAGSSDLEPLQRTSAEAPTPPSLLTPGIPRDLESICLKCLSKAPAQRYASAAELADDLRRYLRGEPVQARPPSW